MSGIESGSSQRSNGPSRHERIRRWVGTMPGFPKLTEPAEALSVEGMMPLLVPGLDLSIAARRVQFDEAQQRGQDVYLHLLAGDLLYFQAEGVLATRIALAKTVLHIANISHAPYFIEAARGYGQRLDSYFPISASDTVVSPDVLTGGKQWEHYIRDMEQDSVRRSLLESAIQI